MREYRFASYESDLKYTLKDLLNFFFFIQIYISIISMVNYVTSSYVLYSVYMTPGMDIYNATLIGSIMTLTLVITILLAVNSTKPIWPDLSLLVIIKFYDFVFFIAHTNYQLSD